MRKISRLLSRLQEWSSTVYLHILPSATCVSLLSYHLTPSQPLIQASALSVSSLETIYNKTEKNKIHIQPGLKKNSGYTGAIGIEIKTQHPGVCVPTWGSSNLFLTLCEIWQNVVFQVLDSCNGSSEMHSIIIVGMLSSVCNSGFKPRRPAINNEARYIQNPR